MYKQLNHSSHDAAYLLGGILLFSFQGCKEKPVTPQGLSSTPNVIYIFPDQMRNHAMGFWREAGFREAVNFEGDPVHTPNLNRFAKESVVLTSAMSNCPLSSPHRGILLTGMYPEHSGVPLNCNANRPISSLREDATCISDVFSQAGYNCAYIGKLHVDCPTPNDPERPGKYVEDRVPAWDAYTPADRRHGFDYWYSYGTYDVHKHPHYWDTEGVKHEINEWSPEHEADKAISYLRNEGNVRDPKKPFFMMVSFNPPHSPYASLEDCMEEDYDLYKDLPLDSLLIRPNVNREMKKAASVRYYFASVTGVDRAFGRILDELEKQGLDKNTLVIFRSWRNHVQPKYGRSQKLALCRKYERPVYDSFSRKSNPSDRQRTFVVFSRYHADHTRTVRLGKADPSSSGRAELCRTFYRKRFFRSFTPGSLVHQEYRRRKGCRRKSHFLFSGSERNQDTSIHPITHNRPEDENTKRSTSIR